MFFLFVSNSVAVSVSHIINLFASWSQFISHRLSHTHITIHCHCPPVCLFYNPSFSFSLYICPSVFFSLFLPPFIYLFLFIYFFSSLSLSIDPPLSLSRCPLFLMCFHPFFIVSMSQKSSSCLAFCDNNCFTLMLAVGFDIHDVFFSQRFFAFCACPLEHSMENNPARQNSEEVPEGQMLTF